MEDRYQGEVVLMPTGRGSKSEREVVQLVTKAGEFILRRRGGNPFRDQVLEALVGKKIEALGRLKGRTLFLEEWSEPEASAEQLFDEEE